MKLGLLTAAFPESTLAEITDWSAENGFQVLEVACWPRGEGATRRYGGVCHIDVATLTKDGADQIKGDLASRGVAISALGYYPNPLHPDPSHRAAVLDHLRTVIRAAALLSVPVVNTFVGADKNKPLPENIKDARAFLPDLVSYARDHNVCLAIENCPMIFSWDEWPSGNNLFYAPATWREIFGWFDDDTLGLNLDPSHLVWQMIDIEQVIREFGSRIYHVHAKDLEIDRAGLYERGILSAGMGWQVPRLPGLGEVPWGRVFSALYRVGYDGPIVIEHEDRSFEGSLDRVRAGFLLARDVLKPFVV
ncbi:MAG: sugar phosphate isomerase/epimerase [Acidothermus sp.]|nr:sugar phosphate isomerase/epimerase [Acidothermus sp.]